MFSAHRTCNHTSGTADYQITALLADTTCQGGRSAALRYRGPLHSRVPQVRCNSSHSNNVAHMRASAATASAQLACEQSCVQDLLAQVAQTTRGKQHQQRHRTLQHAVELHTQQLNSQFSAFDDHLQSGSSVGAAAATSVDHLQQEQRHGLPPPPPQQQPSQPPPQQHQHWLVVPQQHGHTLQLSSHIRQQVQQQALQHAEVQPDPTSQQEVPRDHSRAWHQHRQQEQQRHVERVEDLDQRADLLLQECSTVLDAPTRQQRLPSKPQHPPLCWSTREAVQGWKYSQQDKIARTPTGVAVLRLSTGAQASRQANQLLSWLRREQQVILSAAGATLAHTALECLAQLQRLLQQQYPQYQLSVTADFHSSSRPQGRGRCEVYNFACSLHNTVQADVAHAQPPMQQLQRLPQQFSGGTGVKGFQGLGHDQRQWQRQQQPPDAEAVHQQQLHWHYAGSGLAVQSHSGLSAVAEAAVLGMCMHHAAAVGLEALGHKRQQMQSSACSTSDSMVAPSHTAACEVLPHSGSQQCQTQPVQQPADQRLPSQEEQGEGHLQQPRVQKQKRQLMQEPHKQQQQMSLSGTVQHMEARGTAVSIADALDAALQRSVAVAVPVAYTKQAVKLLEAVAVLDRRWQQPTTADDTTLQVVLHVVPGEVHRQSGTSKRGLHVYLSAAPLVQ